MTPTKHEQRAEGQQDGAWTRDDLKDLIAEAISDSMDMDWQPSWGAESVLARLESEGLVIAHPTPVIATLDYYLEQLVQKSNSFGAYGGDNKTSGYHVAEVPDWALRRMRDEMATLAAEDARHDAKVDAADRADALGDAA